MDRVEDILLLKLLRAAVGVAFGENQMHLGCVSKEEWEAVVDLAFEQGVAAISVDGYNMRGKVEGERGGEECVLECDELEDLRFEWFGSVLQAEEEYARQWKAAVRMTDIFSGAGIKTYVLKGFAVGRLYPVPEHRECGDCDVFLGDAETVGSVLQTSDGLSAWECGNRLMEKNGVKVSRGYYKNSTYRFMGLTVENHRFCSPIRGGRKKKEYERYLQSIIGNGAVRIGDSKMWSPGPLFNALFLMSHAMGHFIGEGGITLRHVTDCHLAVGELQRACGDEGLRTFEEKCREFGIWKFAKAMMDMDERMMEEILHPTVQRVGFGSGWKTRWQLVKAMYGARWKYRLYMDSCFEWELLKGMWNFWFEKEPRLV